MEKVKISAVQMHSIIGDVEANIEQVQNLINRDIEQNVDIIVLPEVWTVGWEPEKFQKSAKYTDTALEFLSNTAKKYNSWIIGGSMIIRKGNEFYNTCPVLDRNGNLVCTYEKNHLFSYYGCAEGSFIKKGTNPVMVNIEGVNVGLTICYDIRFPEIYRAYRIAGADIFVNCAAWGLNKPIPWECMTRSRAVENQTYMIALTQSGHISGDSYNIGHSRIIDYKGESLSEIKDQKEGAMSAVLDISQMYEFREKCKCIDDIKEKYEVRYE